MFAILFSKLILAEFFFIIIDLYYDVTWEPFFSAAHVAIPLNSDMLRGYILGYRLVMMGSKGFIDKDFTPKPQDLGGVGRGVWILIKTIV